MQYSNVKTIAAAVMLVLSVVAVGGAAALTVDTETTTTSTTSDLTTDSVITEPRNSSVAQNIEIIGDSNTNTSNLASPEENFTLRYVVNDSSSDQDGETIYETTENWTVSTVSTDPDHYNLSVSNDAWGNQLEYGADNVTVDARVVFNETESDESVQNITFTVDPDGTAAYIQVADSERENAQQSGIIAAATNGFGLLGEENQTGAAKVTDSIGVSDNTTTLTVSVNNESTQDSFAEVASSDGDVSTIGYAEVNGQLVPMVSGSVSDVSWIDSSTDAYATVAEDGTSVTIENANETWDSGTTSVDVVAVGNDAVGFDRMGTITSEYGVTGFDAVSLRFSSADINGDAFEAGA